MLTLMPLVPRRQRTVRLFIVGNKLRFNLHCLLRREFDPGQLEVYALSELASDAKAGPVAVARMEILIYAPLQAFRVRRLAEVDKIGRAKNALGIARADRIYAGSGGEQRQKGLLRSKIERMPSDKAKMQ